MQKILCFLVAVMAIATPAVAQNFLIAGENLYIQDTVSGMPIGVPLMQGWVASATPDSFLLTPASLMGSMVSDSSDNWWVGARVNLAPLVDRIAREGMVWAAPVVLVNDSLHFGEALPIPVSAEQMQIGSLTLDTTIQALPGGVVDLGLSSILLDTSRFEVRAELWTDPTGETVYGLNAVDGGHQIPAEIGLGLYYIPILIQPQMANFIGDDAVAVFGPAQQAYGPRVRVSGITSLNEARVHDPSMYAKNQFDGLGITFINNPFNGNVSIKVFGDKSTAVLFGNTAGQLVHQAEVRPGGEWELQKNSLPAGLYTLTVINDSGQTTTLVRVID